MSGRKNYWELLQDPRWQRRRLEILNRAEFSCEECGDSTSTLHVHHRLYRKGMMPWEYADADLMALCETCHASETMTRAAIAEAMARMSPSQLERLLGYAEAAWILDQAWDEDCIPHEAPFKIRSKDHAVGVGEAIGILPSEAITAFGKSTTCGDLYRLEFLTTSDAIARRNPKT